MRTLGVGAALYPGRTLPDGVMADHGSTWMLVVAVAGPTRAQVAAIASGAIDLAVDRDGPALVWCLRAPGCVDWSASAVGWWERTAPEAPVDIAGVGGLAAVLLCDAATTTIRALRTVGLTPRVASALRDLEAAALACGRDAAALERARAWTRSADAAAVAERAAHASVVTGVSAKPS